MEPKKSETSQDLAGKSEIGLKSGPLAGKSEIGLKSGPLTGKSEIGILAGKSLLAGKSENIGREVLVEIASKSGALTRSEIDLQRRLGRLARIEIVTTLGRLNRKKDVVCLILSYPPFNSRNVETHRGWIRDVLEINHKAKQVNISELSFEITELLRHSIHDIEAHVPSHIIVQMCRLWSPSHTTPKNAMLDLCID